MKCYKCGSSVQCNNKYCNNCGAKLSGIRTIETLNFKNGISEKVMEIFSQDEKTQEQMRIETCDFLIRDIIGDKSGKELEPYLTNVSIDTDTGCLIIGLAFVPDQFRRQ